MQVFSIVALLGTALVANCASPEVEQALASSYAPVYVECPADVQWIRPPSGLSAAERDWVLARKPVVLSALESYLTPLNIQGFNVTEYVQLMQGSNYANVPTMGLAISGGGWASGVTGTGMLRALDSRLPAAVEQRTGGLLQSLTYMSGQSGGSLPITSFAVNNFPTADEIILQWHPDINRLTATNTTPYAATTTSMFTDVGAKAAAGFNVSVTDFLGRALSYEFVPGPRGGLNVTFSSIVNQSNFINHQMPFPLLQAAAVEQGDVEFFGLEVPFANTTIYEMTPFEFGAWNGSVSGFTPMEWMGTALDNGSVVNASACVQGFDRAGYMMGMSSSAFNFWYIEDYSNDTLAQFSKRSARSGGRTEAASLSKRGTFPVALLDEIVDVFNTSFNLNLSDTSYAVVPNPFAGLTSSSSSFRTSSELTIIDATEEAQAIPFWGQIQPARGSDFIVAWDDNEDGNPYQWNNGTNLYDTYVAANASGLAFPIVPTAATFINRNYTHSPVFFGCDVNLTTTNSADSPIVLYLANSPYSAYENFTFIQNTFVPEQISEIFVNSFNIVTQGNGTLDAEWAVCLGCAAIDRSLPKVGMQRTQQCEQCFSRYCWDGVSDDSPTGIIDPTLILDPDVDYAEWNSTNPF